MLQRSNLKKQAKQVLKGQWSSAVLMGVIPMLIVISFLLFVMWPLLTIIYNFVSDTAIYQAGYKSYISDYSLNNKYIGNTGILTSLGNALFISGISWTCLDILRGNKTKIEPFKDVFRVFSRLFILGLLGLALFIWGFTTLWTFLFVIPGIIKKYSYSQCYFIYYDIISKTGEKPRLLDTITLSRKMMNGYKWQLFLLDLSFLGWHFLSIMTLGLGYLWLNPYIAATKAAFYDSLLKENQINNYKFLI